MTDIEDNKIYFEDSFLSTETIEEVTTQDAYTNWNLAEIQMSTGVASTGSDFIYYSSKAFNPTYGELTFKLRMSSAADCFAFFGFKENLTAPTEVMAESHIGIMISGGKLYLSSASEDIHHAGQERLEIVGLDMTKVYEFKIAGNKVYYKPLPQVEVYLGMPTIKTAVREWHLLGELSNYTPDNQVHYICLYIKNTTGTEKLIYLNRIIYKEAYAD